MRRLCPKFGERVALASKHQEGQDLTCPVGSALGHAYICRIEVACAQDGCSVQCGLPFGSTETNNFSRCISKLDETGRPYRLGWHCRWLEDLARVPTGHRHALPG